ncbi:MAG: hypothetical protein Q8R04_06960 [Nanoarchaeota archaeon]|nr:hypothetical protein [Nanoarchaeota archaeon]
MKNKKALAISFVAIIILILVIMIIMIVFETRTGEIYNSLINKYTCKSSAKSMDIASIKNIALPSDIKCPLQRIEIDQKEPGKIKEELAKFYYDVCDEFGQGTFNLFGKREKTFCVVRDRISFKNKDIKINDFGKYLAETKIPGKKLAYSEFCSGFQTERAENIFGNMNLEQFKDPLIDTNKEYAIIFVYAKGEEQIRELVKFLFGTSESHISMYIGTGLIVGGGILIYTVKGSIIGIPLVISGKILAGGGLSLLGGGAILNYFTNQNIKMEWASFFLIREFDEQELKKLPCEYLPAEQS